jgi:hypothetical protein
MRLALLPIRAAFIGANPLADACAPALRARDRAKYGADHRDVGGRPVARPMVMTRSGLLIAGITRAK